MKNLLPILCSLMLTISAGHVIAQHSDTLHPVADVFVYTWGGGQGGNAYMKFDISTLPANMVVSNAKLEVNVFARVLPWDDDVKFINLNNQTWVEGDNGDMLWNSTKSDTLIQLLNFGTGIGWASSTNIAQILLRDYNQSHSYCTVLLKDPDDGTMGPQSGVPAKDSNDSLLIGNIIGGFNGYIMFRPREYSDQSLIPMFTIDYGIAPEVTIQPVSTAVCYGDSVVFDLTASGDPVLLYQWQKNGSDINGATLNTFTVNPAVPADAGNYRCIVTNAFGADTSDVAVLSVNSEIIVDAGNPQTICQGECVNLGGSPTVSGGTPGYTYQWVPAGSLDNPTLPNPMACPNATTTYCLTVTDAGGCTASDCVTITINPIPTTYNVTGGGAYCSGGNGVAVGLSGSEPGVIYELQCNGVSTGAALAGTGAALNFGNQTMACCYTIVATNASTLCSDSMSGDACVTIDAIQVNVSATPDTICPGDCSNVTVTANGGCSPYTYQWGNPPGGTMQTIVLCPASTSTYTVTVVDCNGCASDGSITIFVDPCTEVSEYYNDVSIQIIPNPFSASAEITSDKYFTDAELRIYDLLGNQVKYINNISGKTIYIERSGMNDGMYFYTISEKNIPLASGKFILK
jgi:hypothetical protein